MLHLGDCEALARLHAELNRNRPEIEILVSRGTCGTSRGADRLAAALQSELDQAGTNGKVRLKTTGCLGYCDLEPIVIVRPAGYRSL